MTATNFYQCPMLSQDRIEFNPRRMLGKPVMRGTRITAKLIVRKISQGATEQELLAAYPHPGGQGVQAVIACADLSA